MKNNQVTQAMQEAMDSVRLSPRLRARTLYAMRGKQERSYRMKRKLSVAMACALIGIMLVTAALAVANHTGLLDFIGQYDVTLPENAADFVQTNIASGESDGLHVAVQEAIYDGRRLRMTVDLKMDGEKPLLTAMDCALNTPWTFLDRTAAGTEALTVLDAYHVDGYTDLYYIGTSISDGLEDTGEMSMNSWSGDYTLQEDGTLTCYYELTFLEDQPQRTLTFTATAMQYVDKGDTMELNRVNPRAKVEVRIDLTASKDTGERYISDAPVEYESIGVRVDQVLMTVKPLEIDYVISYTITDPEKFAVTDEGLWFEFIDPNSTETEPFAQRLNAGLSTMDTTGNQDLTKVQEQTGSLALSELRDTYTMRAYECWNKQRFETHEIHMIKAD